MKPFRFSEWFFFGHRPGSEMGLYRHESGFWHNACQYPNKYCSEELSASLTETDDSKNLFSIFSDNKTERIALWELR